MSIVKLAARLVGRSGGVPGLKATIGLCENIARSVAEHGETRNGKKAVVTALQNFRKTGRNKEIINKVSKFSKFNHNGSDIVDKVIGSHANLEAAKKFHSIKKPEERSLFQSIWKSRT